MPRPAGALPALPATRVDKDVQVCASVKTTSMSWARNRMRFCMVSDAIFDGGLFSREIVKFFPYIGLKRKHMRR